MTTKRRKRGQNEGSFHQRAVRARMVVANLAKAGMELVILAEDVGHDLAGRPIEAYNLLALVQSYLIEEQVGAS